MQKTLSLILFILLTCMSYAQRIPNKALIQGTVMGYHYEPRTFFKKEQVEIQGALDGVKVKVFDDNGALGGEDVTDNAGEFGVYLSLGKKYTLEFSKSGYGRSAVKLDLRDTDDDRFITNGLLLKNLEFILNDYESGKAIDEGKIFAEISFDAVGESFGITAQYFEKKDRLFKDTENSTPHNLLIASVEENSEVNRDLEIKEDAEVVSHDESEDVIVDSEVKEDSKIKPSKFKPSLGEIIDWKNMSSGDLDVRSKEIEDAWAQLEKDKELAVTPEDFELIAAREQMLIAAEKELEAARAYIDEQGEKIKAQRYFLISMIALFILLAGFAFYLIRSIKQKNLLNFELAKKNRKITSSINYAERIQKSVLLSDAQIKAILPNSFVFYQPLDVVSGDFYWFSEINGKVIMAAVDCTGHGVPGAFMSLIGNTLMNQIIKEKKITEPAKILEHLHEGIVESLQQSYDPMSSQDGMDMTVCSLDKKSRTMTFAGAVNPMYVIENGEFREISGNLRGVGGVLRPNKKEVVTFEQHNLTFSEGTNIYLFSDGYMDQFGGSNSEKFNLPRFRELLLEIKDEPMDKQKELVEKRLKSWMGSNQQIDDICVIGVKL